MIDKYQKIIDSKRPISINHHQMSISDRAAQFSPFAALEGYNDVIIESKRRTTKKVELSDNQLDILNEKLLILSESKDKNNIVITYFIKDNKKSGGTYQKINGVFKKIDNDNKLIILQSNQKIPIDDVKDIEGTIFGQYEF